MKENASVKNSNPELSEVKFSWHVPIKEKKILIFREGAIYFQSLITLALGNLCLN